MTVKMFTEQQGLRGFHFIFANGHTVSVQQGPHSYADRDKTVEVAAWDNKGKWIRLGQGGDVIGWQSADETLKIMNRIARRKRS